MGDVADIERRLDQMLDVTVLHMTPALLQSWCTEVARGIQDIGQIATRYGFADARTMVNFIAANEAIRKRIKAERTAWHSEENLQIRLRTLHGLALAEAVPENARPMFDPSTTVAQRVDLLKAFAAVAGVNGMPYATRGGEGGSGEDGPKWSIQINFQGAGKTESINLRPPEGGPQIEGEAPENDHA